MTEKTTINAARVVLGGSAAGAILFVITGVVNGIILDEELANWIQEMGSLIHPPARSISMGLWALMSLIHGVGGVWIYAGIRPRFGAGPRTALLAGLVLWVVSKLAMALDLFAIGMLPSGILAGQLIGSFVAILLGVFAGARLYKE